MAKLIFLSPVYVETRQVKLLELQMNYFGVTRTCTATRGIPSIAFPDNFTGKGFVFGATNFGHRHRNRGAMNTVASRES